MMSIFKYKDKTQWRTQSGKLVKPCPRVQKKAPILTRHQHHVPDLSFPEKIAIAIAIRAKKDLLGLENGV